ncbi:hypothetical protein ACFV2Q_19150 [Streptomyces sp. NPDC059650]|uniref:hypothetical protein n=1 Tax=Streptomyces sp. NPDC059650 TaxID=3346896 RepID=UPI00368A41F1
MLRHPAPGTVRLDECTAAEHSLLTRDPGREGPYTREGLLGYAAPTTPYPPSPGLRAPEGDGGAEGQYS